MGFDLYGKNPENPTGLPKPYLNWSENVTEEQKEVYFKELEVYEKAVPGDYFRANVWCWRPIWNFVAYHCDDILNEEDLERGSYNDGHFINKAKAKKLYTRIMSKIKDGTAQRMQERYEKESVKAKAHNDKIDAKIDELKERVKLEGPWVENGVVRFWHYRPLAYKYFTYESLRPGRVVSDTLS